MATSKFQPTEARKAFPCLDEPHLKATFTITMRHWRNFTALSNMPVEVCGDKRRAACYVCYVTCGEGRQHREGMGEEDKIDLMQS